MARGFADRGGVPRTRGALIASGVRIIEFEGLDHVACMSEPAFSTMAGPAVTVWLDMNLDDPSR